MEIPEFLLEMSTQMNEQPNRSTAHPFWQVRCKRYLVTAEGYNEHHWELVEEGEGVFFRHDLNSLLDAAEWFKENREEWFNARVLEADDEFWEGQSHTEIFVDSFDYDFESLPDGVSRVFVQEVEDIISTHFTEHDAKWFIERKQHDYPKLYTYVESAYWSPQVKQLQDWIKSLAS